MSLYFLPIFAITFFSGMFRSYFQKFNEKVLLTKAEEEIIARHLTLKKLHKKEFLLHEGEVCKVVAFVAKGALREYTIDENGGEHIVQFAVEGWTISDLYSFLTGEPAVYNIEALEDSELIVISKAAHEELLQTIPKYETYTRLNITGAYLAMQKRLTAVFSSSLEERYEEFNRLYPNIVQRIPQHMLASYMGLTPETLSRIRKRIADHK